MDAELRKILEKMYKKRFLSKGIRQIEDFERMNLKIREFNNYKCINELSRVLVDDTQCASATEAVVETIVIMVDRHKELAIREVLLSTSDIAIYGKFWLNILYRMILKKGENVQLLKKEYQSLNLENKNIVKDLLHFQLEKKYISLEIYEEIVGINQEVEREENIC